MKIDWKLWLVFLLAFLITPSAQATDLNAYQSDHINWAGPYVGAHGGYANGSWDGTLQYEGGEAGYKDDTRSLEGDGWHGGLQAGYNFQSDRFVYGLEVDASYGDFNGVDTYATDDLPGLAGKGGFAKKHDFSMDWFGTARVRAGYAFGRVMPYVTGGVAFASTEGNLTVSYPLAPACCGPVGKVSKASAEETHLGWTIGAGMETDLGGGWSVKAEYLYVDLGKEDYHFKGKVFNGAPFETDSFPADLEFNVFRVGMNYRF